MGTRSLTKIYNGDEVLTTIYRQSDGYPDGHGLDLANILKGKTIVKGIGQDQNIFNGMGCLAAQLIKELKNGPGGIYIYSPSTEDCWEDYVYHISGEIGQEPNIECFECHGSGKISVFNGSPTEFKMWVSKS